uniref:Uncharacterized protein n=1 Tax=Musa acuminata subsp. malaccensis TaxID=214687 RepID=A0A804J5Y6_MUSAM
MLNYSIRIGIVNSSITSYLRRNKN